MAENQKPVAALDAVRERASQNPAVERLMNEAESYVRNRAQNLLSGLGDRITDTTGRLEEFAANGGLLANTAKGLAAGESPVKAGVKGGLKAGAEKVKGAVGGLFGGGDGTGGSVKATQVAEQIDIGVPVSVAYNQWTQFQEFAKFMKGVESVEQTEETKTSWRAKIAFSHRSWEATITEQVPDERIRWTSNGDKGHVDGVVTFHELAPNLTRVMLHMEYYPQGLFERTGNLWRAQGRRARLDLKHFRRFLMMQGEETGAWRGEIRDGEVQRSGDEGEESSSSQRRRRDGEKRGGEGKRGERAKETRSRQRAPSGSRERPSSGRRERASSGSRGKK